MSDDNNDDTKKHPPTVLGWIARLVSLALLAGLLAIIAIQIAKPSSPARFEAEVVAKDVREQDGQWLIPVEITNKGTQTAQAASYEIDAGGQKTTVDLDMIGQDETVTFVVPAPGPVETVDLKLVSYEAP